MTIKAPSRILLAVAVLFSTPAWSQASTPLTQVVMRIAPAVTITSNPANAPRAAGSSVQFDAQVTGIAVAAPTGTLIYTLTSLGSEPVLTGTTPIVGGLSTWTAYPPPEGYTISVSYPGDVNYLPLSASLPAGPAEDFDFTLPAVTMAQGATWNGAMQVIPLNSFTGAITWACQNVPNQIGCPMSQTSSTFTTANMAVPQTCPLTITTSPGDFIPAAGLILLGFAFSFKSRRRLQLFAGLAFSCAILFGVTGCGSGGTAQWNPITPKGTYQVTITGVSGIVTHSKQLTVIVQ
jgi:hypothetical protein